MKHCLLAIPISLICVSLHAQSLIDFNKFPYARDSGVLFTAQMLDKIKWESLKKYCDTAKGHYADERRDDTLITTYEYVKQGDEASFKITSYKGMVMEYESETHGMLRRGTSYYFDKNVWMMYVDEMLPNLPRGLKLSSDEFDKTLKAYYRLLGVGTRDEYGWICEYSTIGLATDKRLAVIDLINIGKVNLLKKLIDYPNVQTQLYAIDALIYIDYSTQKDIKQKKDELQRRQQELDSLQNLDNTGKNDVEEMKMTIRAYKEKMARLEDRLLTKREWKMIFELRDSCKMVKTCGNSGSYKIYGTKIADLLSDKAIAEIPEKYENLKEFGYFR
jgi:hypothetical protein